MDNLQNDYSIIFSHVQKAYGSNVVINDLNLEIQKGERLILLGPSGCGKTTTLRMIAGFEEITKGELYMDGRVVNDIAPGERNIAMVFQSYALFPHLSVWDNITFGLQLQKLPQAEMEKRARMAMEILHLEGYENKKTHELSGGQKQRVALCRALVKQSPYFLLDEPLSNLDAKLRQKARTELVKIHEMFKPTMVYVTHDQIEAMTVAHRIAVMNQGRIQQIDTPANIYHHPANTFVATFIGSPAMNILQAEVLDGKIIVGDCALKLPQERLQELGGRSKVEEHALSCAKLITAMNPEYASFLTLRLYEGTPMYADVVEGRFQRITPDEIVDEMEIFLKNVDSPGTVFRTNHASNYVILAGTLNGDIPAMLKKLEEAKRTHHYRKFRETGDLL